MIDNNKEYIVCAAVKRKETHDCEAKMNYRDLYDIELGYRHCDIFHRFPGLMSTKPSDQGFFTSRGRFVNRKDAMKIAIDCGQVNDNNFSELYSEDVYSIKGDLCDLK